MPKSPKTYLIRYTQGVDIGQTLVAARRQAGLSQAQLALRAGTSQATLSAYESGAKDPGASTLVRILAAAGTKLEPRAAAAPVRALSRRDAAQRGRILEQVLELAEALPARPAPQIGFPPIGRLYGERSRRAA